MGLGQRSSSRARSGRPLKIKQKLIANVEAELLRRVRANEDLSRVDLARQLHLAPSTVGAYVDRLIAEGFLSERQKAERDFGRPPTLLALNPRAGQFIGVDFEAHNLMAAVVDFSQQPLRQVHKTIQRSDTVEQIIAKIEQAIEELMNHHPQAVLGIGVGVPGVVDPKNQVVLHYEHIQGWRNIPLGERLANRFKVDVFLENNIRSMALAELWFGQGRGLEHFICLGIRTGIAAGIVSGGRLIHGHRNLAGEIGGWLCPVAPFEKRAAGGKNGHAWVCDRLQPLEQIAAVPAILAAISSKRGAGLKPENRFDDNSVTFKQVVEAARLGEPLVQGVLREVAQTLGWVVCQVNSLFNPQKIILAGPLVELGDTFLQALQEAVDHFCAELHQEAPQVVDSELGSFNGALGAAALALHEWKPKR